MVITGSLVMVSWFSGLMVLCDRRLYLLFTNRKHCTCTAGSWQPPSFFNLLWECELSSCSGVVTSEHRQQATRACRTPHPAMWKSQRTWGPSRPQRCIFSALRSRNSGLFSKMYPRIRFSPSTRINSIRCLPRPGHLISGGTKPVSKSVSSMPRDIINSSQFQDSSICFVVMPQAAGILSYRQDSRPSC